VIKAKFKLLIVLTLLGLSLSIMSSTYSRYVADTTGDIAMAFAKWQILVNNSDITNETSTSITIEPTILEDENVAQNKLAPTSSGYFDILIDPSNVQVSFNYKIEIIKDEDIPDLIIDKYAIIDNNTSETDESEIIYNDILNNEINDSFSLDEDNFEPFTIRVFFEWYDEEDNTMSDDDDTNLITNKENFNITANITFEQKIS